MMWLTAETPMLCYCCAHQSFVWCVCMVLCALEVMGAAAVAGAPAVCVLWVCVVSFPQ